VVVLGHLPELLVLCHLEHPEPDRQQGEDDGNGALQERQPGRQIPAIVGGKVRAHGWLLFIRDDSHGYGFGNDHDDHGDHDESEISS
jgi:hypothetical protein